MIAVGAGGGQLVEYARPCRCVIAVDSDKAAIERLRERTAACGLAQKYSIEHGDFFSMMPHGDVVLFEFCLHEMDSPDQALAHARTLAPDVLVIDHAPQSTWSWYADEDAAVRSAWAAVDRGPVRREQRIQASQRFDDFEDLSMKLASRGPTSRERIERLRAQAPILIPMPYRMALL